MARKVTPKKPARPDKGRDDLSILHPEMSLTLAGRELMVREYGFVDGLRLRAQLKPFQAALTALFEKGEGLTDDVMELVGEHYDLLRHAIAKSAGVDVEWIESLVGDEAETLLVAWWSICGPFFIHPLLRRLRERARRVQVLAGQTSMPPSPTPDTAAPSSSGATPSGS